MKKIPKWKKLQNLMKKKNPKNLFIDRNKIKASWGKQLF